MVEQKELVKQVNERFNFETDVMDLAILYEMTSYIDEEKRQHDFWENFGILNNDQEDIQ